MSIRRLKTLIAIAETGSFARAAQVVSLTPAAVGQHIKGLEDELGVPVFDRHGGTPRLNPLGQALVPKARHIVLAYENLIASLTDETAGGQELTIGAVDTAMAALVPRVLCNLRDDYGHIHVRITAGLSGELYPQVDRGFLDAAVISEPRHVYDHLLWRPFAEEPLIVIAPSDATSDVAEELLESYPYIRFNRQAWVGEQIDTWLSKKNLRLRESMELTTLESISTMVSHNLGVSIVPKRCVASPDEHHLKQVPLGPPANLRRLGVLSRKDSAMFRAVDILLDELREVVSGAGQVRTITT